MDPQSVCNIDTRYIKKEDVFHTTPGQGHPGQRILDPNGPHIKVKEDCCADLRKDNHDSLIHNFISGSNAEQYKEANWDKVNTEFNCSTVPLTLNSDSNDLDTSETSENDQGMCSEEDGISKSFHDTESTELEEEREEDDRRKKKRKESCKICKETFDSSYRLYRHRASHKSTCVVCDKAFIWKHLYEGHMREHAGEQTPYWCEFCEKKFATSKQLQTHHKIHSLKGKFDCSECGASFSRRDHYKNHMKLHADPERNKCEVCGKQYASKWNMLTHMIVHKDEKPFRCVVCEKGFNFKHTMEYHMKSHTGASKIQTRRHKCDVCGRTFGCKGAYTHHMNAHAGTKPFACSVCGITFAKLCTKQKHELTHDSPNGKQIGKETEEQRTQNISLYDCNLCFLSFTSQIFLDHHLLKSHKVSQDDTGTFSDHEFNICGVCQKPCEDSGELTAHLVETHCQLQKTVTDLSNGNALILRDKTISSRAVFKCNICGENLTEETIIHHMLNHGEKKFVCRVCGMKFHHTTELSRHIQLHTGETPFHCTECDLKFKSSEELNRHRRGNFGKQPLKKKYECETCGKILANKYRLQRHCLTHKRKFECNVCRENVVGFDALKKHKRTHKQ